MAHILVVDDEQGNREVMLALLREAGYSVHAASNGTQALAQLETQVSDLLITDMHMPLMDGIELISQCRQLYPQLAVVAVSGGNWTGDTAELAHAGLMGAVETIQKPYDVEDLLGAVERALGRPEPVGELNLAVDGK